MYVSACIHDRNVIPTAIPISSGSGNMAALSKTLSDIMMTGECGHQPEVDGITYTSVYIHKRNETPAAISRAAHRD